MKQLIKNYSYNTTAKTVTLTDFSTILLERLLLIVDTTTNTILYNFADSSIATATVATNVVTLSAASGSNTDKLQIVYDCATGDPTYDTLQLPSGAATSAAQTTGNTSLGSIDTKTPALASGRVPVDGSGVTQPVSGTVTLSGTSSINNAQVSGTAVSVGNGTTDAGTQRITLSSDSTGQVKLAAGTALAGEMGWGSTTLTGSDAFSNSSARVPANVAGNAIQMYVHPRVFNGTSWDRQYNNWNTTTGDTGAKTATFNGAAQTNFNSRGASILFNIGTVSGTSPTLVAKIQGSADGGTTYYDIPGATTTSLTATGTTLLSVYPGATVAANAAVSYPLPRTWRVVYTIGGTTPSFTLTNVQVAYIL